MLIPVDRAGLVIGKGGVGLQSLTQECGVQLDAQREPAGSEKVLGFTGFPANVCAAVCSVLAKIAQMSH